MQTLVAVPSDLNILGSILHKYLLLAFGDTVSFKVKYGCKEDLLMVLAQHDSNTSPDPRRVFMALEKAVNTLPADLVKEVKLYLGIIGHKQPYLSHRYIINAQVLPLTEEKPEVKGEFNLDTNDKIFEQEDDQEDNVISDLDTASDDESDSEPESDSEIPANIPEEESTETPEPQERWKGFQNLSEDDSIPIEEEPQLEPELEPIIPEPIEDVRSSEKSSSLPWVMTGAGIGLFALAGTIYAMTRPCVVGSCPSLSNAQRLGSAAMNLTNKNSVQHMLKAQANLNEAIRLLEEVPPWSIHYSKVQAELQVYRDKAILLDKLLAAMAKATEAMNYVKKMPIPATAWEQVQQLWREAITLLEDPAFKVSSYQALVQQRLRLYRINLSLSNQRLVLEQRAQVNLVKAQEAAESAANRQTLAQNPDSWLMVYNTWQTAITSLRQIPPDTMAYQKVPELMAIYRPQMINSRDRQVREEVSARAYKQALKLANLAQGSQKNNQWSQAVVFWRDALKRIKEVGIDTYFFNKADPLSKSFKEALNQAEIKVRVIQALAMSEQDLKRTCAGTPKICNYSASENGIKVQLTSTYSSSLRQSALQAQIQRDTNAQAGLVSHLQTLDEAFSAISHNAGIPLELYDENGVQINLYQNK